MSNLPGNYTTVHKGVNLSITRWLYCVECPNTVFGSKRSPIYYVMRSFCGSCASCNVHFVISLFYYT